MTRAPDDEQFTALVAAAWPSLYRSAFLLLGDRGEAEDLVQTALTKTYANWSKVRDIDAAPAYARTVLHNTAASWFRRASWRQEHPTGDLPDAGDDPDHSVRPTLIEALRALPPRQRAVIVLRYYEDLSEAQIAEALDMAPGTVKSHSHAALRRLSSLLDESVEAILTRGEATP